MSQVTGILEKFNNKLAVKRLTALWAFSEAALGGILHAAKIPFTGMFIGGVAIILISLIFHFSEKKTDILKSTLLVILVKGLVSPYTPVAAYFAVFIQGTLGYLFFSTIKSKQLAPVLLGLSAMLLASMQKIIIYTIIYGNTLWESVDLLGAAVFKTFGISDSLETSFRLSLVLIGVYTSIHLTGGLLAGIIGARLPFWIAETLSSDLPFKEFAGELEEYAQENVKKKKAWWKKKSFYIIPALALILIILSFIIPGMEENLFGSILFMFLRAVIILLVWYKILYPLVSGILKKYLLKKSRRYSENLEEILILFPHFKNLIRFTWTQSRGLGRLRGLKYFLSTTMVLILLGTLD